MTGTETAFVTLAAHEGASWLVLVALAYGTLVALAPLAQLARILARRSSGDISLAWVGLYAVGSLVWLSYGLDIGSAPLIVSQAVTLGTTSAMLAVAAHFRYGAGGSGGGSQRPGRQRPLPMPPARSRGGREPPPVV